MKHLLLLEWKKFKSNSVFALLTAFYFLFLPASYFIYKNVDPGKITPMLGTPGEYVAFPKVWTSVGYMGSWLIFFFIGVIAIFIITSEITYKTQRQTIINGLTRTEYFLSKLQFVSVLCFIATIYYVIVSLVIGIMHTEDYSFSSMFENEWAIPRYFLMSLGFTAFAMFLATFIRSFGISIFVYFSYILALEPFFRWQIHHKAFDGGSSRFYPMNAAEDLTPNPFKDIPATNLVSTTDFKPIMEYPLAAGLTIVFTVLFLVITHQLFLRRDM